MTRELWRVDRTGSIDDLHLDRDTPSSPGRGEVTVSVGAVGLNLADVVACLGRYSATPPACRRRSAASSRSVKRRPR
jgi:NADPH:quinone reductase-like Zn-dependent oxidoreductase